MEPNTRWFFARAGNFGISQKLINAGAGVTALGASTTALETAIECGNVEMVRILLFAGAAIDLPYPSAASNSDNGHRW